MISTAVRIHTYSEGTSGGMVIVILNGHSDPSSNSK